MLPCNHYFTFDVLRKADPTLVQRRNIDVENTLWIWFRNINVIRALPLQHLGIIESGNYYLTLKQRYHVNLTSLDPRWEEVVNFTFNVAATLSIEHSWYIWTWTYYSTLRKRWSNFTILTFWHQRHYNAYCLCDAATQQQTLSQHFAFAGYRIFL